MNIIYKLTDKEMRTYNGYQWKLNEWHETSGEGGLCGPGWLHGYEHPWLAVIHNPIHADIVNPRLFECECRGEIEREGLLKCGVTRLRLVRELELPEITGEQRIAYGIYCAKKVYTDEKWNNWADAWLEGKDRSADSAASAASAARAPREAAWAAAWAAARAADSAAARAAREAAWAAASAAASAAACTGCASIDLIECVEKAMRIGKGGEA